MCYFCGPHELKSTSQALLVNIRSCQTRPQNLCSVLIILPHPPMDRWGWFGRCVTTSISQRLSKIKSWSSKGHSRVSNHYWKIFGYCAWVANDLIGRVLLKIQRCFDYLHGTQIIQTFQSHTNDELLNTCNNHRWNTAEYQLWSTTKYAS